MIEITECFSAYSGLEGREAHHRVVLARDIDGDLIKRFSVLECMVLMPWMAGNTRYDIVDHTMPLSRKINRLLVAELAEAFGSCTIFEAYHDLTCNPTEVGLMSMGNLLHGSRNQQRQGNA